MLNRASLLFTLSLLATPSFAQSAADWQQRVHYTIDVDVDVETNVMEGRQRLVYQNNSPDTLRVVFFHLYFNAFQPNSMMAERNRVLPDPDRRIVPRIWELDPDEIGYHRITRMEQNGNSLRFEINDTIMRVYLRDPILPNSQSEFEIEFLSQIPLQTRRSGRDNREGVDYSMSQWYPKIAGYDERGWHADPYVGREFYAPFGSFDVTITMPENYVLGATGTLRNAEEVGHGYASNRDSLNLRFYSPRRKLTWQFSADNVHDFAWVADPDFIHERFLASETSTSLAETNPDLEFHLLYLPDVATIWTPMKTWVPEIIEHHSNLIGPYAWPQFTVAQAGDGAMEYPMINFVTGRRTPNSLFSSTSHEAAHEWFYGMLGSNESDYSWMDEGFTSYATSQSFARIIRKAEPSHTSATQSVVVSQLMKYDDRLNTPADWFHQNRGFSTASYRGGEMVLDMLGYVISDSLRDAFIKNYYSEFLFRHPDPFDVERVAEQTSGLILDWYFEQFTNSRRTLDLSVAKLKRRRAGALWRSELVIRNAGDAIVPVDVRFDLADGQTQYVTIPLSIMEGNKPVPDSWKIAPAWRWTESEYTLVVELPAKPIAATIDPEQRTPDVNRLNNSNRFPVDVSFLRPIEPTWSTFSVTARPVVSYAHDFGFGAGLLAEGSDFLGQRSFSGSIKVWPSVLSSGGDSPSIDLSITDGTWFDGLDFNLRFVRKAPDQSTGLQLFSRKHLGIWQSGISLERRLVTAKKPDSPHLSIQTIASHLYVDSDRFFKLGRPSLLQKENMLSVDAALTLESNGFKAEMGGSVGGSLKSFSVCPEPGCTFDQNDIVGFAKIEYETASRGITFGVRTHVRLGVNDLALHRNGRLGSGSLLEAWSSPASGVILPILNNPTAEVHAGAFSGSGPVAYHLRESAFENVYVGSTPRGTRLLEGSTRIESPRLGAHGIIAPLRLGIRAAAGTVWGNVEGETRTSISTNEILAEAGPFVSYNFSDLPFLDNWIQQSQLLRNLEVHAVFPIWINKPGLLAEENDVGFRWFVGIKL